MSKRREYTPATIVDSTDVAVVIGRELHPDVSPIIGKVVDEITQLGSLALNSLPKPDTREVLLFRSESVRRHYTRRTSRGYVLDTADVVHLEQELNQALIDTELPTAELYDDMQPLRVDELDRLVIDMKESNELQIDRCTILRCIANVLEDKKFSPKDIDGILNPIVPALPIAQVNRRMLGNEYTDFTVDPLRYIYEQSLQTAESFSDVTETFNTFALPTTLPLGKISVRVVCKTPQNDISMLEECFPDDDFDGVVRVRKYSQDMEFA